MAKSTGKRKNAMTMDFYGSADILNKIEAAGGNVERAIGKAVVKAGQIPKREMEQFMSQHKYSGLTDRSMTEDKEVVWKDGKARYRVGYDIKKGGMAALFLDIGTPRMKPYFFVYHAMENNFTNIKNAQELALKEALRELL